MTHKSIVTRTYEIDRHCDRCSVVSPTHAVGRGRTEPDANERAARLVNLMRCPACAARARGSYTSLYVAGVLVALGVVCAWPLVARALEVRLPVEHSRYAFPAPILLDLGWDLELLTYMVCAVPVLLIATSLAIGARFLALLRLCGANVRFVTAAEPLRPLLGIYR